MVYTDGTHLIADSVEELHKFAELVGLRREWYQDQKARHPHYDLTTERMKLKAVRLGAKLTPPKELIKIIRRSDPSDYQESKHH